MSTSSPTSPNNLFSLAEHRAHKTGGVVKSLPDPWTLSRCSNENARRLLDYESARRYEALPLYVLGGAGRQRLYVALSDTLSVAEQAERLKAIQYICDHEVSAVPAPHTKLGEAIFYAYHSSDEELMQLVQHLGRLSPQANETSTAILRIDPRASDADIPKFLCAILDYAIAQQASDIHISARSQGSYLTLRCQGALRESREAACSLAQHKQLVNRIRVLCGIKNENPYLTQDASFLYSCAGVERCLRVSILPSFFGESCVIRLPEQSAISELHELGLSGFTYEHMLERIDRHEGLMLFSGPTGSGKTTSMYACLLEAAKRGLHIISIEDPIERVVPGVTQIAVQTQQGLDFSQALRASLRQDPDVIMLGEIRDPASAKASVQAAITGHLVLATLHARDIAHIPARLEQLGVSASLCAQSLDLIVNQRLVPHLCKECKQQSSFPRLAEGLAEGLAGHQEYAEWEAPGCQVCQWTGRGSRHIIEETFVLDEKTRQEMLYAAAQGKVMPLCFQEGKNYYSPREQLCEWYKSGLVSKVIYEQYGKPRE